MNEAVIDILLVEDREEDAELALMALNENNLLNSVKWVKDGQEALDFLYAKSDYEDRTGIRRPKLILLDLRMPKVDGLEVLRKVRETLVTKSIPIVVLTTSAEEKDIVEAYNLGVNSYILKPVDFEKFSRSIQEIGMYWVVLNEPPIDL